MVKRVNLLCFLPELLVFKFNIFDSIAGLLGLLLERLIFDLQTVDEILLLRLNLLCISRPTITIVVAIAQLLLDYHG